MRIRRQLRPGRLRERRQRRRGDEHLGERERQPRAARDAASAQTLQVAVDSRDKLRRRAATAVSRRGARTGTGPPPETAGDWVVELDPLQQTDHDWGA